MPNPGQELAGIDFSALIGGPLDAVIVDFKKSITEEEAGGDTTTKEPIYVTFKYPKELSPYQPAVPADPSATPPVPGSPAVPAVYEEQELRVPVLTIPPIPFIRIDLTTIDFNAKINSVECRKTDTGLKVDASFEAEAGWSSGSAKLNVSTSFQRTTQQGNTVDRTYSLAVHVKAVQDEMPAGMEKMLSILEGAITS
jgi:hypothetical protein